jgi:hypothetical protein
VTGPIAGDDQRASQHDLSGADTRLHSGNLVIANFLRLIARIAVDQSWGVGKEDAFSIRAAEIRVCFAVD